jgi:HupE / UreJ protein
MHKSLFHHVTRSCCWLWFTLVIVPGLVLAHEARPIVVTIAETLPGIFQYSLRVPPSVAADNQPVLIWPQLCSAANSTAESGTATNALMTCVNGLSGQQLQLVYPLFNPALSAFFRLTSKDGNYITAMLAPTEESWTVPQNMTTASVAGQYLQLGIAHIIGGFDHLLFVLGLLVIARTPKRILLTVTGFTLAHSLTLSLSALGFISIAVVPVEATIALSIVFLAHEISVQNKDSLTWRYPLLIAFGFGLLHGLGFASALGEIGLVQNEILLSLLFFNLGVEVGQMLFIVSVVGLVFLVSRLVTPRISINSATLLVQRSNLMAAYVIGVPASYWLFERMAQFLG